MNFNFRCLNQLPARAISRQITVVQLWILPFNDFFFCNSRSKVQSPATELLSRSETRRRPPPFQQPQDKQDENRRIDYDAYSDYDYNDFDSEIPFLLNQCKSRNNRKNAGKSLMKNIESMPKFEHFPMRSGQLLSSGLESRLSDLG